MTGSKAIHAMLNEELTLCGLRRGRFAPPELVSCRSCLRVLVFTRDGNRCVDCVSPRTGVVPLEALQRDSRLTLGHVVAQSNGGLWRLDNLVTQCSWHNRRLGNRTWEPGWDERTARRLDRRELLGPD